MKNNIFRSYLASDIFCMDIVDRYIHDVKECENANIKIQQKLTLESFLEWLQEELMCHLENTAEFDYSDELLGEDE